MITRNIGSTERISSDLYRKPPTSIMRRNCREHAWPEMNLKAKKDPVKALNSPSLLGKLHPIWWRSHKPQDSCLEIY